MLTALILLVSSFIQGVTGFGFSMVAIPLLAFVLDMKYVVVFLVIECLFLNLVTLFRLRRHLSFKRVWLLFVVAAAFTPLGVWILQLLSERALLLGASLIMLFLFLVPLEKIGGKALPKPLGAFLAGAASGTLNASVGVSGPPLILYFQSIGLEKQHFRGDLTLYFFCLNIVTVATMAFKELVTANMLKDAVLFAPAVLVGTWLGVSFGDKIDERLFKQLVKIAFVVILFVNIYKALR